MNYKDTILRLEKVTSTNDLLKELAQKKENKYKVIVAYEQTGGRGQKGNSFFSPMGGFYGSFLIRPTYNIELNKYLSIRVALAIKKTLESLYSIEIKLKWINDIIYQDKKLGGILVENKLDFQSNLIYSFIGIGLNLNKIVVIPNQLNNIYVSLNLSDYKAEIEKILDRLILEIFLLEEDFDVDKLVIEYNKALFLKGHFVELETNGEIFDGRLLGINKNLDICLDIKNEVTCFSVSSFRLINPYKKDLG